MVHVPHLRRRHGLDQRRRAERGQGKRLLTLRCRHVTDTTADAIRDLAAWEQVVTRDFTTVTRFYPHLPVPVVQVFMARPQQDWHPESTRTAGRFDRYLVALYARAERDRAAQRRAETIRKAVEQAETARMMRELFGDEQ